MKNEPKYLWDEDKGIATCILKYNNYEFWGRAYCHPDDKDMQSKLTGQQIAEYRALIKVLRFTKNCELKPKIAALKQYYYSINRSKQFNPKSYEIKMLYRQIQNYEFDLDTINKELVSVELQLNSYLTAKEETYKIVRKLREAKNN